MWCVHTRRGRISGSGILRARDFLSVSVILMLAPLGFRMEASSLGVSCFPVHTQQKKGAFSLLHRTGLLGSTLPVSPPLAGDGLTGLFWSEVSMVVTWSPWKQLSFSFFFSSFLNWRITIVSGWFLPYNSVSQSLSFFYVITFFSWFLFNWFKKSKPFLGPRSYKNGRWFETHSPWSRILAGAGRITPRVWCM